ncbi:MAG: ThuA domain-containing protein, partial [Thermoanaerobaculia bacterium]
NSPVHRQLGPLLIGLLAVGEPILAEEGSRVLVFSKTVGFRHESIPAGIDLVRQLGAENGFAVDSTEDAGQFSDQTLGQYAAVVWLNTTLDVLTSGQESAFKRYIESGGGFVGVHSAADTEYGWPWFGKLLGGDAWFKSHPEVQEASLDVEDRGHPSSRHFPLRFSMTDEWYNFQHNPRDSVSVLIAIDETTYEPGVDAMGDHPIAWYHGIAAGRSWYTNMGHGVETYDDPGFQQHLLGGLLWAAGRIVFWDGFESGDAALWSRVTPR